MVREALGCLKTVEHIPAYDPLKSKILGHLISEDKGTEAYIDGFLPYLIYDPGLTMEFLKLANSEAFSYRGKISSLEHALMILEDDLIELIISQHPLIPEYGQWEQVFKNEMIKLIKHSIEVRVVMKKLLNSIDREQYAESITRQELLTASVIHDIGHIFLLNYFPDSFLKILKQHQYQFFSKKKRENAASIPDHALLGSILCKRWNLPDAVTNSIAFHHYPWFSYKQKAEGAELLYIADNLSPSYYLIYFGEDDIYSFDEHIIMKNKLLLLLEKYNIELSRLMQIKIMAEEECEDIYKELGL
jgi:HD-like signal output (HDOD) protein